MEKSKKWVTPNIDIHHGDISPINLDHVFQFEKAGKGEHSRIEFYNSNADRVRMWRYEKEEDRDEDFARLLDLLNIDY
jgi:hypothetical protein